MIDMYLGSGFPVVETEGLCLWWEIYCPDLREVVGF